MCIRTNKLRSLSRNPAARSNENRGYTNTRRCIGLLASERNTPLRSSRNRSPLRCGPTDVIISSRSSSSSISDGSGGVLSGPSMLASGELLTRRRPGDEAGRSIATGGGYEDAAAAEAEADVAYVGSTRVANPSDDDGTARADY